MKPEIIHETIRLWEAQPGKAKARPAVAARSDGSQAILESGSFSWKHLAFAFREIRLRHEGIG
jgi:hypothetical protein